MIGVDLATKQDYDALSSQVSMLKDELTLLRSMLLMPKVVKIKDIARMERVSVPYLYAKGRYLLPRFGVSAYDEGTVRWDLDEYLKWREIPQEKRLEMWWNLPAKERQRIVMKKAS